MSGICCFAGHSELYDTDIVYERLLSSVKGLLKDKGIKEFWVGDYGAFDRLASKAVWELKKDHPEIQLNLVIPYMTSKINNYKELYYKNYSNILIADIPEKTPHKAQIIKCNHYMVNNSTFLICYVEYSYRGAFKTLEYAKKQIKYKSSIWQNCEIV